MTVPLSFLFPTGYRPSPMCIERPASKSVRVQEYASSVNAYLSCRQLSPRCDGRPSIKGEALLEVIAAMRVEHE
jgi:hypothetical protein